MTIGILRVRLPHEDEELTARVHPTRRPPLPAIDHEVVALAKDASLDVRRILGGDIRFGHRETRTNLSIQKRTQPSILLFRSAEAVEDLHVTRVRSRHVE